MSGYLIFILFFLALTSQIAFIWCLILRYRIARLYEHQQQLESNLRHIQLELATERNNRSKVEMITLEQPNDNHQYTEPKRPIPVVPFNDIDTGFWKSTSAVIQREKLKSGIKTDSKIRTTSQWMSQEPEKDSAMNENSHPHRLSMRYLGASPFSWICLIGVIWGISLTELYWYQIIGIDELYINGVLFLLLSCIIMAVSAM